MNVPLFLPSFFVAFAVSVAGLFALDWACRHFESRRLVICRFGGALTLLAFSIALVTDRNLVVSMPIAGLLTGAGLILFFGIGDDIVRFGWKVQIFFQSLLPVVLFAFGVRIFSAPLPWGGTIVFDEIPGGVGIGFLVLFAWTLLLVNAMNWADGIDGLLPSIVLVSSAVLFALSLFPDVNQPPLAIISLALFGSALGLFLFNAPKARLLSGTSGSFFFGFTLASLSVLSGTKIATALLVLAIPILDALWVIVARVRAGTSPFCGDTVRHLHYRLREIGWSDRRIVFWYATITAMIGFIALSTRAWGKFVSLVLVSAAVICTLFLLRRKTE